MKMPRFSDSRVHEGVVLKGTTARLNHDLLHFTDDSLEHYMWKFNRYTSLAADELGIKEQIGWYRCDNRPPDFYIF